MRRLLFCILLSVSAWISAEGDIPVIKVIPCSSAQSIDHIYDEIERELDYYQVDGELYYCYNNQWYVRVEKEPDPSDPFQISWRFEQVENPIGRARE